MALIHYLYIGHFVPEDGLVRFEDHRPVASRPIDTGTVARLVRKHMGETGTPGNLPDEWHVSILPDYILGNYGSAPSALRFDADYAEQEGAIILDLGSFALITPSQLRQSTAFHPAT